MKLPTVDRSAPGITTLCGIAIGIVCLVWFFYPLLTPVCESFSLVPAFGYGVAVFAIAVAQATRARQVWQLFAYWLGTVLLGAVLLCGLIALFGPPLCFGS